MKRLIKKADNTIKLMCGTTTSRVVDIINSGGFEAGAKSGWGNTDQSMVFFTNDENNAMTYSEFTWDHDGANYWDYLAIVHVELASNSLYPDNDDCPECETWEESLDQIGQVGVKGKVSTSQFTRVDVFKPENKSKIGSYSFDSSLEMKLQGLVIIDAANYQIDSIETAFKNSTDANIIKSVIDRANLGLDEICKEFEFNFPRFEYVISEDNSLTMTFSDVTISTNESNDLNNFEQIKKIIDDYKGF